MKKYVFTLLAIFTITNCAFANQEYFGNMKMSENELAKTKIIMDEVYAQTSINIEKGNGPFYAVIYDKNGKKVAEASNSVVLEKCSHNHAEMNAIKNAQKYYGTYDLSPYDLSIYVNAEPCMMCAGAIMWSGIKHIYYGVPSKDVERVTGFNEGYKGDWTKKFKTIGIDIIGGVKKEEGINVLESYVISGKTIYKPSRDEDEKKSKK